MDQKSQSKGKKILKGCGCSILVAFILFIALGVIGMLTEDDSSTKTTDANGQTKTAVSNKPLEVPELTGRVVDVAGVLKTTEKQDISNKIRTFETRTKGGQFAVLIIPSLNGTDIQEFGIKVLDKWKIGRKGVDDGLILLIVINDRKRRIEVGYGYEGVITDARAGDILRATNFYMKKSDYRKAIVRVIEQAQDLIVPPVASEKRITKPLFRKQSDNRLGNLSLFIAITISALILIFLTIISGKQLLYGERKKMKELNKVRYCSRIITHVLWLLIGVSLVVYGVNETKNSIKSFVAKNNANIADQQIKSVLEVKNLGNQRKYIEYLMAEFNRNCSGNIEVLTVGNLTEENRNEKIAALQSSLKEKSKNAIVLIIRNSREIEIICSPDYSALLPETELSELAKNTNDILSVYSDGTGVVYALETLQSIITNNNTPSRVEVPTITNHCLNEFIFLLIYLVIGAVVLSVIGVILFGDIQWDKANANGNNIDDWDQSIGNDYGGSSFSGSGGSGGGGGADDSW